MAGPLASFCMRSDGLVTMNTVIPIIALLGAFLSLLLAAFLIVLPSRIRLANALLALFLAATAIDISAWFMGGWWGAHPAISSFRPVLSALQMPLFTGFIWLTCFQERRLKAWDLVHLLPALFVFGFFADGTPMPWLRPLLELQFAVYICISIFTLWRFDRLLRARFVVRSRSWRWLALLVAFSLLAHGLYIVRTVFAQSISVELSIFLQVIAALLVLGITLWIAFQALLKPDLFRSGDRLLVSAASAMVDGFSDEHERLAVFMEEQRPYLDPDLTLSRLAGRSGIAAKGLSALINQRHGLHFFDFVNSYRIDHAKTLLVETEQDVTNIIYASGFNAKSSFNTAFRKHTNTTPTAYRRDHAK